jgi:hypothetical protein
MIKNYSKESLSTSKSVNKVLNSTLHFLLNYSKANESVKIGKQRILICKN